MEEVPREQVNYVTHQSRVMMELTAGAAYTYTFYYLRNLSL